MVIRSFYCSVTFIGEKIDTKVRSDDALLKLFQVSERLLKNSHMVFHKMFVNDNNMHFQIPQIGLFLFLLQDPLNVGEVMHLELERCFMMPRESNTVHRIMTSLLSSPFQRLKYVLTSFSFWHFFLSIWLLSVSFVLKIKLKKQQQQTYLEREKSKSKFLVKQLESHRIFRPFLIDGTNLLFSICL